jgi:kinetochore protein Spc24, fungi type
MGLGKVTNHGEGLLASKEAELLPLREQERALEDKDVALEHNLDSTTWVLSVSVGPPHDMNSFWAD